MLMAGRHAVLSSARVPHPAVRDEPGRRAVPRSRTPALTIASTPQIAATPTLVVGARPFPDRRLELRAVGSRPAAHLDTRHVAVDMRLGAAAATQASDRLARTLPGLPHA